MAEAWHGRDGDGDAFEEEEFEIRGQAGADEGREGRVGGRGVGGQVVSVVVVAVVVVGAEKEARFDTEEAEGFKGCEVVAVGAGGGVVGPV